MAGMSSYFKSLKVTEFSDDIPDDEVHNELIDNCKVLDREVKYNVSIVVDKIGERMAFINFQNPMDARDGFKRLREMTIGGNIVQCTPMPRYSQRGRPLFRARGGRFDDRLLPHNDDFIEKRVRGRGGLRRAFPRRGASVYSRPGGSQYSIGDCDSHASGNFDDDNSTQNYDQKKPAKRPTRSLFVGNLDRGMTEDKLRQIFEPFGFIETIDFKNTNIYGSGPAYAFIQFFNLDMAERALRELSDKKIGHPPMRIGFGSQQPSSCLWVGGIGPWTDEAQLTRQFSDFGKIARFAWPHGKSYAYVLYDDREAAITAMRKLQGLTLGRDQKRIRMDFASVDQIDSDLNYKEFKFEGMDRDDGSEYHSRSRDSREPVQIKDKGRRSRSNSIEPPPGKRARGDITVHEADDCSPRRKRGQDVSPHYRNNKPSKDDFENEPGFSQPCMAISQRSSHSPPARFVSCNPTAPKFNDRYSPERGGERGGRVSYSERSRGNFRGRASLRGRGVGGRQGRGSGRVMVWPPPGEDSHWDRERGGRWNGRPSLKRPDYDRDALPKFDNSGRRDSYEDRSRQRSRSFDRDYGHSGHRTPDRHDPREGLHRDRGEGWSSERSKNLYSHDKHSDRDRKYRRDGSHERYEVQRHGDNAASSGRSFERRSRSRDRIDHYRRSRSRNRTAHKERSVSRPLSDTDMQISPNNNRAGHQQRSLSRNRAEQRNNSKNQIERRQRSASRGSVEYRANEKRWKSKSPVRSRNYTPPSDDEKGRARSPSREYTPPTKLRPRSPAVEFHDAEQASKKGRSVTPYDTNNTTIGFAPQNSSSTYGGHGPMLYPPPIVGQIHGYLPPPFPPQPNIHVPPPPVNIYQHPPPSVAVVPPQMNFAGMPPEYHPQMKQGKSDGQQHAVYNPSGRVIGPGTLSAAKAPPAAEGVHPEIARRFPVVWSGALVLKNSAFVSNMYLVSGSVPLVDTLLRDPTSPDCPVLKISQRLRLDEPQKLNELEKRIASSGRNCCSVLLAAPAAAEVGDVNNKIQQRALSSLGAYLHEKECAAVIFLPPGCRDGAETGVLHAFPPCKFALDFLRKEAPDLVPNYPRVDHLLIIVMRESHV